MKPKLQEVGPFVYKAVTVKDSRDSLVFNDDGETLTYRPRQAKICFYQGWQKSGFFRKVRELEKSRFNWLNFGKKLHSKKNLILRQKKLNFRK